MGIILLIAVAAFSVWILTQHREAHGNTTFATDQHDGETALEILRKRYARGEISREEYEARRRDLV